MSRSPRERSSLFVQANVPSAQVKLLDHSGRVLKTGVGSLDWKGEPGIYQLQVEAGSVMKKELVTARPDETSYHDVAIDIDAVTPVRDSVAHHEFHAGPAAELSVAPNMGVGSGSRLVLFARVIDPGLDSSAAPVSYTAVELLTADGEVVATLDGDGVGGPGFRALSIDVDPGLYRLRSEPRKMIASEGAPTVDQTIVACADWTTLAFIPVWPNDEQAAVEAMAVHMVSLYMPFNTDYDDADTVLAAELALQGLRSGEVLLPDDVVNRMLYAKFVNPMLGIYGGHALLMKRNPNWSTAQIVVRNLRKIIPDHPDVVALHLLLKERRETHSDSRVPEQVLPPMLRPSYDAIIRRDAREPGLIVAGSIAELASSRLRSDGAWARWGSLEAVQIAEEAPELFNTAAESIRELFESDLVWTEEDPAFDDAAMTAEPTIEVAQMAQYVNEMAEQQRRIGVSQKIDVAQLSRQVGLPTAAVKRGLRSIDRASTIDLS